MTSNPTIALTVDVEDAHHGLGVAGNCSSLQRDIEWILDQFRSAGVRATFFVLGEVVWTQPELVKQIALAGHEIGFHGATHEFLRDINQEEFERGLVASIPELEHLADSRIFGFRAPFFSITPETQWCFDVLAEHGFEYDASVYPGRNDRYGWPGSPTAPYVHGPSGLRVFPVPLLHPRLGLAFSGGAYLRILPGWIVGWGFRRQIRSGRPGMVYFHPWEISSEVVWRHEASFRKNLTRHLCRKRMRPRLKHLLGTKANLMKPMRDVIEGLQTLPTWGSPE